jgi:dTDP-4-dehydrorhamnose 3,5-epimerase
MITGVKVKQLKAIPDERGRLMEMLRKDDDIFIKFGQIYMTTALPGAVKAWHYHKKQVDTFVVVKGMLKLVLYDGRQGSKTHGEVNEFFLGDHNQIAVQIPRNIYHGFKGISDTEAIVINCPTEVYDPKEPDEYRLPAHTKEIPYDWARKDR